LSRQYLFIILKENVTRLQ